MTDKTENRYSEDEVLEEDGITYLRSDMKPVNGIVYGTDPGCKYERNYKYGNKDGLSREWDENGQFRLEENYKDGEWDGLCRVWSANGQLVGEYNFKDGKKDGIWRLWYENGQLNGQGNYKDEKEDGLCRRWYEHGQLAWERNWKDGQLISSIEWDEQGNLFLDET